MGFFTDDEPEPPQPEDREVPRLVPRDHYGRGRPLISVPCGSTSLVPYTRASSLAEAVVDSYGLSRWQLGRAMVGIGRREDLYVKAIGLSGADDEVAKKAAYDLGQEALVAGDGVVAANLGTGIAAIVERVLLGERPAHAGAWQPTVDAILRVLDGFEVFSMERFVVNDEFGSAGSYDYYAAPLGWMQAPDGEAIAPGTPMVLDTKTAQLATYFDVKFEAQIGGVYCGGVPYRVVDEETGAGQRFAWSHGAPHPRWALIVHAPAGGDWAQLRWVDVQAGCRSARRAVEQRAELAASKKRFQVAAAPVQQQGVAV